MKIQLYCRLFIQCNCNNRSCRRNRLRYGEIGHCKNLILPYVQRQLVLLLELAELSQVAEHREVFRVLLGLLPSLPSLEDKRLENE